jgi:PAS domain S-box-containing protein
MMDRPDLTGGMPTEEPAWGGPQHLGALVDAIPALVSAVDPSFIYRFVNRSYSEWFGRPASEIVGRHMADVLGADTFAFIRPKLEATLAGETIKYEATLPYRTGGHRFVLATYTPERDERGQVIGIFVLVQDLTARRRAEVALAESERALRASGAEFDAFFALPNVGKVQADPATGRIVRVNRKLSEITGYAEERLIGRPLGDLTPGTEARVQAFTRGEVDEYSFEPCFTRGDGSEIWLRVDASMLRDENGAPKKAIAAVRDITDEKRSQQMLLQSERTHRLLVSLQDATRAQRDPARVLQDFVRIVATHFDVRGCAYGEVDEQGQFVTMIADHADGVPPFIGRHQLADLGEGLNAQLRAGVTVTLADIDEDPRADDLARRTFAAIGMRSGIAVPLVKDRRLVAVMALHHPAPRDWTRDETALMELIAERTWFALENARAEVALREHRDVLALAMRGGRMGAWSRDLRTNRVWWSHELEEIAGLEPGGFAGHESAFFEVVHADDRALVNEAVVGAIESHSDYTVEFRFRHASGAWRWMEGRGRAVYSESGEPVMLYGIGIDITERKRAEDELRRLNAELSEADRRKDQFIALLAHELRNPLAPVRFSLELLRLPGASAVEHEQARVIIDRQVAQMTKLLDDLLDVARVGRGKLQVHRAPVSLNAALQMAVETSRPLIERQRHELSVSLPAEEMTVLGDPVRLTQVFANLLNNAARYTPAGGTLSLLAQIEGERAVVRVVDNGVGLRPDQLRAIFKPFAQAHEPGYSGGLGLGLSLAQAIVTLHHGTIEAHSEGPSKGTEFVVALPLAAAPATERPADAASRGPGKVTRRVLVVDDNRDAADAMAVLLEADGHHVTTVYDGTAALASVTSAMPEVVLLDIGLPDVTGYEVAQRIRAMRGGEQLTVVAISGWGQARDKQLAFESGFDAHLTKPADPAQVRELLAERPARPRG